MCVLIPQRNEIKMPKCSYCGRTPVTLKWIDGLFNKTLGFNNRELLVHTEGQTSVCFSLEKRQDETMHNVETGNNRLLSTEMISSRLLLFPN